MGVVDKNPAGLVALYPEPGDDNGYAVYLGVQCTDAPWPRSSPPFKADNVPVDAKAPFPTWGDAWFNAPCVENRPARALPVPYRSGPAAPRRYC